MHTQNPGRSLAFGAGLALALLILGVGTASALSPGETAEISGSYVSGAATSSSDPNFAPCSALPPPRETFWAFLNGNERISADLAGVCTVTSSPDPNQAGVTDYALTYTYRANWGIVVNDSDVGTTMTLTMRFHLVENVVATATYEITAVTTTPDTTSTTPSTTAVAATTSTGTAPSGSSTATATTQLPPPAPPAATTTTTTTTAGPPVTSGPATTIALAIPRRPRITTPATIRAAYNGKLASVTIRSSSKHKALLCYRATRATHVTCKVGRGTWTVRLPATPHSTITRVFTVKVSSTVVARKTITIRVV